MQDLYLDPSFTVEGDDFVFNAHDDNNVDYNVKVTFDDVAFMLDCMIEVVSSFASNPEEREVIFDACTGIVDRFQTGTTFYDVEITKKQPIDPINYKCQGRKYKVLKQLSPYFGKTMKEVSILSIQGKIKGVCFDVLQGDEWDSVSFLFSELEEIK